MMFDAAAVAFDTPPLRHYAMPPCFSMCYADAAVIMPLSPLAAYYADAIHA